MFRAVLFSVLLAALAAAQKPVIVNDLVDRQMASHNEMLTKLGLGISELTPGTQKNVQFSKGIQAGVNTLKRTGTSTALKKNDAETSYKYRVGYDILLFAFNEIKVGDKSTPAYFTVKDNTLDFDFTVYNGTHCKVTLDAYRFTKLAEIGVVVSNPSALPEDFASTILFEYINKKLEEKMPYVEGHLQAMCRPSDFPSGHHPAIAHPSTGVTARPLQL